VQSAVEGLVGDEYDAFDRQAHRSVLVRLIRGEAASRPAETLYRHRKLV